MIKNQLRIQEQGSDQTMEWIAISINCLLNHKEHPWFFMRKHKQNGKAKNEQFLSQKLSFLLQRKVSIPVRNKQFSQFHTW